MYGRRSVGAGDMFAVRVAVIAFAFVSCFICVFFPSVVEFSVPWGC